MTGSKFYVLNREVLLEFGSDAALLLAELAFCQDHFKDWFYKTQEQIQAETALSPKLQLKAVNLLKSKGILKTKKVGMPAKTYYLIDVDKLAEFLPKVETSLAQKDKQEPPKGRNKVRPKVEATNKEETIKNYFIKNNISFDLEKKIIEYFEYRNSIKRPLSNLKSIETKISQLGAQVAAYGELAVLESIDSAIANGWQGTFIDKKYINPENQKRYELKTKQQATFGFIQDVTSFEL